MLISCVKLDHALYSINYGIHVVHSVQDATPQTARNTHPQVAASGSR